MAIMLESVIGKENVIHVLLEDCGHGGPAFSTEENLNKVFVFPDKILKESK
jgi:hypothetical protein